MMDEQIEHEYCQVIRGVAKKHGAKVEFDVTPNMDTEQGSFLIGVKVYEGHLVKRLCNLCYAAAVLAIVASHTANSLPLALVAAGGLLTAFVCCIFSKRLVPHAPAHVIHAEVDREWMRRHPDHISYS